MDQLNSKTEKFEKSYRIPEKEISTEKEIAKEGVVPKTEYSIPVFASRNSRGASSVVGFKTLDYLPDYPIYSRKNKTPNMDDCLIKLESSNCFPEMEDSYPERDCQDVIQQFEQEIIVPDSDEEINASYFDVLNQVE